MADHKRNESMHLFVIPESPDTSCGQIRSLVDFLQIQIPILGEDHVHVVRMKDRLNTLLAEQTEKEHGRLARLLPDNQHSAQNLSSNEKGGKFVITRREKHYKIVLIESVVPCVILYTKK